MTILRTEVDDKRQVFIVGLTTGGVVIAEPGDSFGVDGGGGQRDDKCYCETRG